MDKSKDETKKARVSHSDGRTQSQQQQNDNNNNTSALDRPVQDNVSVQQETATTTTKAAGILPAETRSKRLGSSDNSPSLGTTGGCRPIQNASPATATGATAKAATRPLRARVANDGDQDEDEDSSTTSNYPGAIAIPGINAKNDDDYTDDEDYETSNRNGTNNNNTNTNTAGDTNDGGPNGIQEHFSDLNLAIAAEVVVPEEYDENQFKALELEKEELQRQLEQQEETLIANAAQAEIVVQPCKFCGYHWATVSVTCLCCSGIIVAITWIILIASIDTYNGVSAPLNGPVYDHLSSVLQPLYAGSSEQESFLNESTPQGLAFQSLLGANYYAPEFDQDPTVVEVYAILVLYYATNETGWIQDDRLYWPLYLSPICEWNDGENGDEFDGVRCNKERTSVIGLIVGR
jgi:hypothetical protein